MTPYRPLFSSAVVLLSLFAGVFLTGCSGFGYGCTANVERAVEVTVLDAETGKPIAEGAVGTLKDGSFAETMSVVGWLRGESPEDMAPIALGGAYERRGVYTVRIEKPGYSVWEARDVRVDRDQCHVNTRRLEARLQRLPD